ncbi:hypothetical protein ACWT_2967 [Actinoplanes sp. SE50]|uniref:hypothetical protein n=1 Tax=unclassified Actinoplanes TaxID=2626549 RepID=UPI00023EBB80|nr:MULTISPECIES: hypothetical protein [unclassified Actinoplanes]AEV83989.1 hypothetical protein ACPL_3094 [Actinoplanes sp. SE50/110]ATO82382.1 hypothetical protein ACWT_2967 [Actinoplanes sp. SE50]SLL99789.1 hypothetical protein ACSP50_3021 [Actinoplanes sp. SE50/110]
MAEQGAAAGRGVVVAEQGAAAGRGVVVAEQGAAAGRGVAVAEQGAAAGRGAVVDRGVAGMLAMSAAFVGVWAAGFPVSFYRDFPWAGAHWVSALGPYNEHLVRDVGGLYLALLVVSVGVVRRPTLRRVAGGAWLVFSAEHLLWHALHLDAFSRVHQVTSMVALSVPLALSALLLRPERGVSAGPRDT